MPGTCILKSTGQRGYYQNVSECRDTDSIIEDTSTAPIPGATVTENAPYASDTRPVAVGYTTYNPGVGVQPAMTTVYEGVRNFERVAGAALSRNASQKDKNAFNALLGDLRRVTGSELGTLNGQRSAYYDLLQYAASSGQNVEDILKGGAVSAGGDEPGAGPRGTGAYSGPRETITMASERDLRTAVDAMASQVLGRAATEDEFKKALEQVRTAERTEPTITTTGVGRTVTQSGLTAEGRSDIIREALMQGPEAEDFGKATKMMDLFYSALEARPEGA